MERRGQQTRHKEDEAREEKIKTIVSKGGKAVEVCELARVLARNGIQQRKWDEVLQA